MNASSLSGECASLISTVCSLVFSVAGVAVMAGPTFFALSRKLLAKQAQRSETPLPLAETTYREDYAHWELARRKAGSSTFFTGRSVAHGPQPGKCPTSASHSSDEYSQNSLAVSPASFSISCVSMERLISAGGRSVRRRPNAAPHPESPRPSRWSPAMRTRPAWPHPAAPPAGRSANHHREPRSAAPPG